MAKVQMPLMGVSARGQLAKSLVYFDWKGINVVRKYVIPANPRTQSQLTQRGYFTSAVDAFHSANFTTLDRSAWNTIAGVSQSPQSGFNYFVKLYVKALVAGKSFTVLNNCTISNITDTAADVEFNITADKTSKLYWGTTKTFLANSVTGTFSTGKVTFNLSNLPSNSVIYFRVQNEATNEVGSTGIYSFRTLVA